MNQEEDKRKKTGPGRFRIRKNRHYAQISAYVVLTAIIIYILIRILDHLPAAFSGIGSFFHALWVILKPLTAAFVIAYLLYPVEEFFRRHLEKAKYYQKKNRSARPLAVLITFVLVIAALILLLTVMISAASHEIKVLSLSDFTNFIQGFANSLKSLYSSLKTFLAGLNISSDELDSALQKIVDWLGSAATNAGNSILNSLSNLSGILGNAFFAFILSVYFLLDAPGIMRYWDRVLKAIGGKRGYNGVHLVLSDANRVFSGYIRGQLLDAAFMFAAVSIALSFLRVRFALLIGLMTGIGNLIPYVGPIFAYGGTAISCFLAQDWQKLIVGIIVVFIIQTVDGNVIGPKLMSHSIHIHPMLVIIALIIGSAKGGLLGMLIAVPVAGLLKLWFDRLINYIVKKRNSDDNPENDIEENKKTEGAR